MSQVTVAPAPADAAPPARTESSLAARLGAEAFGTFGLVLAIVGVALYNRFSNGSYVFAVAIAGGLGVAALIAAVGHVSGGHFNPAVTFGLTIAGRSKWRDLVPYWVAQVVGGAAAAALLFATIPDTLVKALSEKNTSSLFAGTANGWADHSPLSSLSSGQAEFSLTAALLVEVVVTAVFVGVIIGVTDKRAKASRLAPISIGFALFAAIIVSGPITNASVNPARSTASALFSAKFPTTSIADIFTLHGVAGQLWLFWVAPLIGAGIAALFYLAFAAPRRTIEDEALSPAEVVVEDAGEGPVVEEAAGEPSVSLGKTEAAGAEGTDEPQV